MSTRVKIIHLSVYDQGTFETQVNREIQRLEDQGHKVIGPVQFVRRSDEYGEAVITYNADPNYLEKPRKPRKATKGGA